MYFSPKYWPWNTVLDKHSLKLHQIAVIEANEAVKNMPLGDTRIFEFRRVYDESFERLLSEVKMVRVIIRGRV